MFTGKVFKNYSPSELPKADTVQELNAQCEELGVNITENRGCYRDDQEDAASLGFINIAGIYK